MRRNWKTHREFCMRLFTASDFSGNETTLEVFAKDTVGVVCERVAASILGDASDTVVRELSRGEDVLERSSYMSRLYKITDTANFLYKLSVASSGPPSLVCSSDNDFSHVSLAAVSSSSDDGQHTVGPINILRARINKKRSPGGALLKGLRGPVASFSSGY